MKKKKKRKKLAHFRMAGYARHTVCTSVFSFIPQGNGKKSILKYLGHHRFCLLSRRLVDG